MSLYLLGCCYCAGCQHLVALTLMYITAGFCYTEGLGQTKLLLLDFATLGVWGMQGCEVARYQLLTMTGNSGPN